MYIPFDLHVLSTPPAFILSQDQTLMLNKEIASLDSVLDIRRARTGGGENGSSDRLGHVNEIGRRPMN